MKSSAKGGRSLGSGLVWGPIYSCIVVLLQMCSVGPQILTLLIDSHHSRSKLLERSMGIILHLYLV